MCISREHLWRFPSFEKQAAQTLAVPVLPDQFADVLARGSVALGGDLIFHKAIESFGKRYVHRAHDTKLVASGKLGKHTDARPSPCIGPRM